MSQCNTIGDYANVLRRSEGVEPPSRGSKPRARIIPLDHEAKLGEHGIEPCLLWPRTCTSTAQRARPLRYTPRQLQRLLQRLLRVVISSRVGALVLPRQEAQSGLGAEKGAHSRCGDFEAQTDLAHCPCVQCRGNIRLSGMELAGGVSLMAAAAAGRTRPPRQRPAATARGRRPGRGPPPGLGGSRRRLPPPARCHG